MEAHSYILPFPGLRPDNPDALLTLSEAYDKFLLPEHRLGSKSTISGYYTTLKKWAEITGDPPISAIDDALLLRFRDAVLARPYSPHYIRKMGRELKVLFRRLGPRSPSNPGGQGVLDECPYLDLRRVVVPRRRKRRMTLDEIAAFYRACPRAEYPRLPVAGLIWQTAAVLLTTYGPRREDLCSLSARNVILDERCPDPEIDLTHPHGWLEFVPRKTRHKKPEPLILPLSRAVRAHLDELWRVCPQSRSGSRLLPFTRSTPELQNCRKWIQREAGLFSATERPYTFQEWRLSCNMLWQRMPGCHGLGPFVLGHAPRGVNEEFYTDRLSQLCEEIDRFPLPACMTGETRAASA